VGENSKNYEKKQETELLSIILKMMEENRREIPDRIEQNSLNLAKIFQVDIDKLNERLTERLETQTLKVSEDVASLREEIQQKIEVVNSKFNSLSSSVNESLKVQMAKTKQNHVMLSKTLMDHR
jgi:gas vesicle protein